ncbi:DUF3135 domain-containing protein [Noviherbaspirillum massiliense]|uniref:DUF3135 domain-containing protein n=1 Tax=Noviherbaspirillum massiliense TaxID=1465823 RepID=UPI00030503CD|nr:DUF3135 domain-containing protein [Noviherbaspirillum massiliense]
MKPVTPIPDFDMLVALHQQDPEAFEAFRRHLLRDAVDAAPPEHRERLQQLLTHIDSVRDAAATPLEAMVAAFRMMQDSLGDLRFQWQRAHEALAGFQTSLLIASLRR